MATSELQFQPDGIAKRLSLANSFNRLLYPKVCSDDEDSDYGIAWRWNRDLFHDARWSTLLAETILPNHGAASLVRPSMTRTQVVKALGVMYDDSKRGEYADVDDVILKMNDNAKIKCVCNWRIAFSSEQFWVGLDADENVVTTYLDTTRP